MLSSVLWHYFLTLTILLPEVILGNFYLLGGFLNIYLKKEVHNDLELTNTLSALFSGAVKTEHCETMKCAITF